MRVAISYDKFAMPNRGGACKSLLALMDEVAKKRDIIVDAYQTPPIDPPETEYEYEIHVKDTLRIPKLTWTNQVFERAQWGRYIKRELDENHDLLITQTELGPVSVEVAESKNIPSIFFIRSMPLTGYQKYSLDQGHISNFLKTDFGGRIQYPFLVKNFQQHQRAIRGATCVVANSEFTAGKIKELHDVDAEVIYPPIRLNEYRTEYDEDGYITMINPRTEYKGPDIFLNIADAMPEEDFLLVGDIGPEKIKKRVERTQNATHWEWCDDMKEAYSVSKVVVTPSRWEEPFGRAPAEAMVSGIPCVVSNRGGLPEVVGDTGEIVKDIELTEAWLSGIENALKNHKPKRQKKRVRKFSVENQSELFNRLIEENS